MAALILRQKHEDEEVLDETCWLEVGDTDMPNMKIHATCWQQPYPKRRRVLFSVAHKHIYGDMNHHHILDLCRYDHVYTQILPSAQVFSHNGEKVCVYCALAGQIERLDVTEAFVELMSMSRQCNSASVIGFGDRFHQEQLQSWYDDLFACALKPAK